MDDAAKRQFNLSQIAIGVTIVAGFLAVCRIGNLHLTGCAIGAACGAIAVGSVHKWPWPIVGAIVGFLLFWPMMFLLWLVLFWLTFELSPGFPPQD